MSFRAILGLALGPLTKVGPVISQAWYYTKNYIACTPAKKIVCNPIIYKLEGTMCLLSNSLIEHINKLRDKQLQKKVEYLERKLKTLKPKMPETECASKALKSNGSVAWQYLKVESAPPMTINLLNGPLGKTIENGAGKIVDTVINTIAGQIQQIELNEKRKIQEKEAAAKALLEKQKAEEKKKSEAIKAAAEAAAKQSAEKAKKAAEAKKASDDKKAAEDAKKKEKEKSKGKDKKDTKGKKGKK